MLHLIRPSVGIVLGVAGILVGGAAVLPGTARAQAGDLTLHFHEVEAFARASSPRLRIIDEEAGRAEAEKDAALQWSNPGLAYDHEQYSDFIDWQLTVNKRFEMPFNQSSHRSGWKDQVRSAELRAEQDVLNALADLKAGYVWLRLREAYMDRLAEFGEFVAIASSVAETRHQEGELSGIDQKFIELSALSIDASYRQVRRQHRAFAARWRAEMGIPPGTELALATPVTFRQFGLQDRQRYLDAIAGRPGVRSRTLEAAALGKHADAVRPSLVPGMELYGGYKRFDPGFDGWVAGLAVDLPLFDRKGGPARQFEAEQRIAEAEIAVDISGVKAEIVALLEMIEDTGPALAVYAERCAEIAPLADVLLVAYREGSITLDAFLNSLQIEAAALENYYGELHAYYQNVLRLEALTGVPVIDLTDPGE